MAEIAICDDSSFTRKMIINILKTEGHSFVDTDDGDSLLNILREKQFDCIFLDLLMPNKSGFDILKELKNRGNKCPIVIISADTQETTKQMCLSLGASAYLNKPPQKEELIQTLKKILS